MQRTLKLTHFIGLALFLGSIFTYIAISSLIEGASMEGVVFGRNVIQQGTQWLTLPGLWMLVLSGVYNGYVRFGAASRFFRIKLLLGALIVANAHLIVVPAVKAASEIARQSLSIGHLLPEYQAAYLRESFFGGVNVMLALAAAGVAVWRRSPS